ncbi:hypothetical protein H0H87_009143 [Tephrocybe sp. NHM501043]|nr:hypothetical protein H0H87_009143 [Tephrocybe sp. NHM501043]
MAPSRELIEMVSVMCESLLVGAYAVLVGLLSYITLTGRRRVSTMQKLLFWASITMFMISAVHLGLVMQQFSVPAEDLPLANFQAQIVLSFVIGDLVLIWRVWVIWGRNCWVAAGPFAIMVVAAGLTFNLAGMTETRPFFTVAPVAMIVANTTICTLLIAGKIWYMHHQVQKTSGGTMKSSSGYKGAMILIIESGSLYALSQLISLILDRTGNVGLPVMLNLEIPLIGILPTLIVLLVHFNMVPGNSSGSSKAPSARRWEGVSMSTFHSETVNTQPGEKLNFKTGTEGTTFDGPPQEHFVQVGHDAV